MKDKPTGPFWFYRDPRGWWQLNLWILFFFASDLSFGFRLFDFGLSFSIRGLHTMPFSRRYVNKGSVLIQFLPPCGVRHPYIRFRRWLANRKPIPNP